MGLFKLLRGRPAAASSHDRQPVAADVPRTPPAQHGDDKPGWIEDGDWLTWEAPLDIVAGESHYRQALERIAGPPRFGGWLVPCEAALQREPDNRHDPDAVAVLIGSAKVGYISGDVCGELADALDVHGPRVQMGGVPALVRGGYKDKPNLGVMLWLDHEVIRKALPEVDWQELREDWGCRGWPPREASADAVTEPTSTGRQRHQVARSGREPRVPPLVGHFSDYVEDVQELKRRGRLEDAEALLLALIEAVESESRRDGLGVAPWYYEQMAIVRRKRGDLAGEIEILERFAAQPHAPGKATPKVLARLEGLRRG